MVAVVMILGIFMVFIPIVDASIKNGYNVHHTYNIQRSLMAGLKEGYEAGSLDEAMDRFINRFDLDAPKGFNYTIEVVNFDLDPKMLQIKVTGVDVLNREIIVEKTIIEEVIP